MAEQTNRYLLNAKKLLGKIQDQPDTPHIKESMDEIFKYLNSSQRFNKEDKDQDLLIISKKVEGESSPVKLFAKAQYEQFGYIPQPNSSPLVQKLQEETEQNLIKQRQKRKYHSQRNKQIIESLNEFDEIRNPKLPMQDIVRECQLFPEYLDLMTPEYTVKSSSTFKIQKMMENFQFEVFQRKIKQQEPIIQIELEEEAQDTLKQKQEFIIIKNINNLVTRNPKFLKLFGTYIKYFIKCQMKQDQQYEIVEDVVKTIYKPLKNIKQPRDLQQSYKLNIYNTWQVFLNQVNLVVPEKPLLNNTKLFQKVANKRSGKSMKFHPKTFIMRGEQLVYHGEDQNIKMIVIKPQLLTIINSQKQVGGFFSRERIESKSFMIQGEEKEIEIQYNELEGSQMYKIMTQYFAKTIYNCYCVQSFTVENKFKSFLDKSNASCFDFTQMICQNPETLLYCFPFWFKVLDFKRQLSSVSFKNNRLDPSTMQYILRQMPLHLSPQITNFQISGNQIQNDGLRMYCQIFLKFKMIMNFELYDCNLNTYHIETLSLTFKDLQDREVLIFDIGGNPDAKIRQTSNNIFEVLNAFKPRIFKINEGCLKSEDIVDLVHFRFNIVELQANNCGIQFSDEIIKKMFTWIERNYLLKAIRANGNKVTASDETLLQILKRPQLNQLAIDFPGEFFTDYKNPDNQWFIVPIETYQ